MALNIILGALFSKIESDYLTGKVTITKSYERVLKHRINAKLRHFFMVELPFIKKAGITEFYNGITENHNVQPLLHQNKRGEEGI